jgi:hypothetical protein
VSIAATIGALGEVALALSPWAPGATPRRAADAGAAWLTSVLARGTPGARVVEVEDRGGSSGTTDRRRLALTWNDAGVRAGLPSHVFVKATSPSAKNRAMVAALRMAIQEVRFYEQVRPTLGDVAPRAYYARAGHGARFILVLEDLLAQGARPVVTGDECTPAQARAVIDLLAQLHAAHWRSPRLSTDLAWGVHGDPHVGNTYVRADGGAGLLDWQVVFSTRGVREISYFVTSALDRDLRRALEKELIQRYLDGLAAAGVPDPPSFEAAWDD